jgi:pimeloyl-ACP methyl ester carboxylesterase
MAVLRVHVPRSPVHAVVLVLHGGQERSTRPVRPWSLALLRMYPFAFALRRAGRKDGLAVAQLRHTVRGWNGSARSPVGDARWAVGQLRARFPDVPIGLVGHSMGGRTALAVADEPGVRSVVALAPWIEPEDPIEAVRGRRVLIAHGSRDRMTDPYASAVFAEHARPLTAQLTYLDVVGERHALLRRARLWHALAAGFTLGALLNRPVSGTGGADITNIVNEALAGQQRLRV